MLIVPPRLLVADEISLGLAPVMIDAVYDGLRRINAAGTALLIVEQQVDRVLDIAANAVVLEHGAVAYRGPASGAMAAVEKVLAARSERTMLVPSANGSTPSGPAARPDEKGRRDDPHQPDHGDERASGEDAQGEESR